MVATVAIRDCNTKDAVRNVLYIYRYINVPRICCIKTNVAKLY